MNNLNRRSFFNRAAGLAALGAVGSSGALLSGCSDKASTGPGGEKLTEINVGYIGDGNGATTVMIAEQEKLWEKHGLKANLSLFTNGPLQIQALGTGDIDFGYIGPGALWLPMQGKATITSIVSLGTADRVIAQPGISDLQGLAGKKVGVPEGTSGDMLLGLALDKAGMKPTDITKVVMEPPTVVSAFSSGQIDGAAIWYPHVGTIKKSKPDLVEVVKSSDYPELAFPACLVAGPKITEKADILSKFQAVAKDANQWNADHRDQMVGLLAKFLKAPEDGLASEQEFVQTFSTKELASKTQDGTVDKWFTTLNQLFVDLGKLDQTADPVGYYLGKEFVNA